MKIVPSIYQMQISKPITKRNFVTEIKDTRKKEKAP